ncbi:hypothetical protein LTR05_007409 [Lithohypha guttulata]|uniref:Triosephosphate isomerase n=1 Tax=Lithohypha guttulata TaxID=1690604 RepID=A0AAN7Y4M2_9EURO|nr:hypothetical protein LTR05_007409 [Lithohypha guttulata]
MWDADLSRKTTLLTALYKSGIMPLPDQDILFGFIPDFLSIYPCTQLLSEHAKTTSTASKHPRLWPLHLGAQDCFWSGDYGAYTGEIVPPALQSLGVTIVELGHAERRKMLAETDETTAKKAAAVSKVGMVPLVCIGEIEAPNLQGPMSAAVGNAMKQLNSQVLTLLSAVPLDAPVIFAYEPVWAIGAAQPAGVDYVGPVVQAIRHIIQDFEQKKNRTGQTKVVYGGSAGPGLWSGKTNGGNPLGQWVDGMFLGRFAHKIEGVKAVVDEVVQSMS